MEKIEFSFDLKEIGTAGEFEGWASTYDLDLGKDKVLPGAFKTSIRKNGGRVPVLFNHDRNRIAGVGLEALEDQKGLYVKAKLAMGTQLGQDVYELMSMGALKGLSIGYTLPAKGWVMDGTVRLLKAIDLQEYSATPFPMNTEAQISRVKTVDEMTEREFEEQIRDVFGFSQKEAKKLIAEGFRSLKGQRDAGSDEEEEKVKAFFKQMNDDLATESWLQQFRQQQ